MEIAKIYVNGVTAVASNVKKIPKGIIGATIKVTFANDWFGLSKTAVFQGVVTKDVLVDGDSITIPAECVDKSGYRLRVGFYGVAGETLVIPTIWMDLGMIQDAADPSGDTSTDPALPIWAQLQDQIDSMKSPARIDYVTLYADKWVADGKRYSQVVEIANVTKNSQVDLTPSAEQLVIFHDKTLAFVTHNVGGVVIVYAIGQKPTNDYTIQVTLTEVKEMKDVIIGVTVGTSISPEKIKEIAGEGDVADEKLAAAVGKYLKENPVIGKPGENGFSPAAKVTQTETGATVTITDKNGTTEVVITNGKNGVDGQPGKDGADGAKGDKGDQGIQGIQGEKGDKGDPGEKGEQGIQGEPGQKGDKGDKGDTGSQGIQGEKGDKGDTGATGANGKDGTSVTVKSVSESTADGGSNVVTFSDGKTLTVKNGKQGSAGKNGADGKTPVKGVDFWTDADQEAIVQQVITALGTPVFGRVDTNNNIILTGELADGTYTVKYENADGEQTTIGTLSAEDAPTYTNILPLAINSDKTPYNGGQGWKTGYRLNSSGAEATVADWEVTGFIPISTSDTLYFKDIQFRGNSQKHDYIGLYNSSFTSLTSTQVISVFIEQTLKNAGSAPGDYGITLDADNNLVSIDFKKLSTAAYGSVSVAGWQNVKYIRFSCFGITDESIITKNEPIE